MDPHQERITLSHRWTGFLARANTDTSVSYWEQGALEMRKTNPSRYGMERTPKRMSCWRWESQLPARKVKTHIRKTRLAASCTRQKNMESTRTHSQQLPQLQQKTERSVAQLLFHHALTTFCRATGQQRKPPWKLDLVRRNAQGPRSESSLPPSLPLRREDDDGAKTVAVRPFEEEEQKIFGKAGARREEDQHGLQQLVNARQGAASRCKRNSLKSGASDQQGSSRERSDTRHLFFGRPAVLVASTSGAMTVTHTPPRYWGLMTEKREQKTKGNHGVQVKMEIWDGQQGKD